MDKVPAAPEGPGTKFLSRPGLKTESMDRNVQCELFPVSSPIIGSTFVHDGVSDGAAAVSQLQGSSTRAPRGPDCACLFTSLGSILCSVTEDSCCYNSVLVFLVFFLSGILPSLIFLTSGPESDSSWEFSHAGV